jgi:hypothetical protein
VISAIVARKPDGSNQPVDILVWVRDDQGNSIDGATVAVTASGGSSNWSGTLTGIGGGFYAVCNVGRFNGNGNNITIGVTASKAGYMPGSGSGRAARGNLAGCP